MSFYCKTCSIELQDEYSYKGHLAGKRHLKNQQREDIIESANRSVFIAPLPKFMSERNLLKFFFQFGIIQKHKFGINHLIIEFTRREPVDLLLSRPIWIGSIKLNISKKQVYTIQNVKTEKCNNVAQDPSPVSCSLLEDVFKLETTFNDQLAAFLNIVLLSDAEIETRYDCVFIQLDEIFRSVFPNVRTHKFGSTKTGLAFKESDLDIYMDIGNYIYDCENSIKNAWVFQKAFKEVKKIMYKMNTIFSNIVPIPKAKTPIIKFTYVPTNVSCDISFKSGLGVYNSCFIKHCLSLDIRLKPLAVLIKYWAKYFNISGTGKISNYALIMLLIFCFQQPSVAIIPPLMEFQKKCPPEIVHGWQVNFNRLTLPQNENHSTIPQLLEEFFAFYSTFTFKSNVICPLDGTTHSEDEFKDIKNLPPCMNRYKEHVEATEDATVLDVSRPMCVQDPIELDHNITASTSSRIIESFQECCRLGHEACILGKKNNYKDFLKTLFTIQPKQPKDKEFIIVIHASYFLKVGLPKDFDSRTDISDKEQFIRENWYLIILNMVKDIFEKVMKLEVQIVHADKETKQQKVEVSSDVHTKDHEKIVLQCSGQYRMWQNRKCNKILHDSTLNWLEKEALISNRVMEDCIRQGYSKIKLEFICKFEKEQNPVRVILKLYDKNSEKKVFNECANYLQGCLPKIINKTLVNIYCPKTCY